MATEDEKLEDKVQEKPEEIEKSEETEKLEEVVEEVEEVEDEKLDVDTSKWVTGRVIQWKNTYGFIIPDGQKEKVFVHASNCESEEKHPSLRGGMEVRYHAATRTKNDQKQNVAVDVQCVDGSKISWFKKCGESDRWDRQYLLEGKRFKGKVKRFFFRRKFGWIEPVDKIDEGDVKLEDGKDLFVFRDDIVTDDFPPGLRKDMEVEFSLYKRNSKDSQGIGACKVTAADGSPVSCPAPVREEETWEKIDEEKVFTATVQKFKVNNFVFIKPEEDLSSYGFKEKELHCSCLDIDTKQSPAVLKEGMKISFTLYRDNRGFHGRNIRNEDGTPIDVQDVEIPKYSEIEPRESCGEQVFQGTVKSFRWTAGIGWIVPKEGTIPEEIASKNKHEFIYFNRDDLISTDKILGIDQDTEVSFTLYTDSKGLGANNIQTSAGEKLSGFKPPPPNLNKRYRGVVTNYNRRARRGMIRYRGKNYNFQQKDVKWAKNSNRQLPRNYRVEFSLDRSRGKPNVQRITQPGRQQLFVPNRRPYQMGGPQMQGMSQHPYYMFPYLGYSW